MKPTPFSSRRAALVALASLTLAGCSSLGGRYTPQYLDGQVVEARPLALSAADTHVSVRLLDVSLADAPSTVLAEQIIELPKAFPVAFSLCYDRASIKPGHRYTVDARVYVKGELKQLNQTPVPVLGPGLPTRPQVAVEAIGH
ncbi:YbaY family lipoprotein [Crenobacter cavernae]|uniref:Lipoprotein n=1 Tax=Crenobacter cavernae TaxID=2290923 RepID=A0A345YA26_9NEIS|nr:YbaY family lipoprotein [Crenobacter cavernae]AXK40778.1 hypothetical protein DWG20_00840 [Crenobacter cavernae]